LAGPTPHVPLEQWVLTIDNGTNVLRGWSWRAFRELPAESITTDIHCVTRWSKLDTRWEGVSLDTLLADITTDAAFCARPIVWRVYHERSDRRSQEQAGVGGVPLRQRTVRGGWVGFGGGS
jgi:DMSO/TMAO reductase YedYZ molybdopterin-dependent catalytic subunit